MGFLYSQLFVRLPYPSDSAAGKTIIITGSNAGLGREAARHYARLGCKRLILAVRNLDKGNEARLDIEETTNCGKDVVQVWQLDMSSYANVQEFAARVASELNRLDIFIANAGISPSKYTILEDNESSVTVNVVSTMLLVTLIVPTLKATVAKFNIRPTLTIVTSETHRFTSFPHRSAPEGQIFATMNDKDYAEKHWFHQYPVSKLLEIYAVRAVTEQYPASTLPVTINCVNPGLCKSNLVNDIPMSPLVLVMKFMSLLLARTSEAGSRTLVHAGFQGVETHGQYMSDCGIEEPSAVNVTSKEGRELQKRVWAELVQKLEAIKPGVAQLH